MKRLSIIVPMYNVEPYVERCLRSLEDQDITKDEYEIICINDGSPDDSRGVVIRIQKEFDNIFLIEQENLGVSRARNNGIDKAIGRYLLFIDPDDYVEPNSIARVLKSSNNQNAQVSFLGYTYLNEDGTIRKIITHDRYKGKDYSGIEAYLLSRGDGQTDPDRMVAVLFETDFLNRHNLRYLPGVPYLEDGEFIARILCLAEHCIFEGHSFYQRTTRPGSATNSKLYYSEKSTNGFLLAASNLKRFQQKQNLNKKQREFLNQPIVKFVLLAVGSSIGWKQRKKFAVTIQTLKGLTLRKLSLKGCDRIYRLYGSFYNLSPFMAALTLIVFPRLIFLSKIIKKNLLRD